MVGPCKPTIDNCLVASCVGVFGGAGWGGGGGLGCTTAGLFASEKSSNRNTVTKL